MTLITEKSRALSEQRTLFFSAIVLLKSHWRRDRRGMSCTECWYSWVVVLAGIRSACSGFCLVCHEVCGVDVQGRAVSTPTDLMRIENVISLELTYRSLEFLIELITKFRIFYSLYNCKIFLSRENVNW